ncbi:hypothetical protein BGZ65_008338, partial [Modicella reniformis]
EEEAEDEDEDEDECEEDEDEQEEEYEDEEEAHSDQHSVICLDTCHFERSWKTSSSALLDALVALL